MQMQFVDFLEPFTAHSAFLLIVGSDFHGDQHQGVSNLGRAEYEVHNSHADDLNSSNGMIGSQIKTSTSGDCDPLGAGKKKTHRKHLTWSSFCKAASECSDFDLAAIYSARKSDKWKKFQL